MFEFSKVPLPAYSRKEDLLNSITHLVGVPYGILLLILCISASIEKPKEYMTALIIYGIATIVLFFCSGTYHGLKPSFAKKVFRVIDHSVIFILISGTVTPFAVIGLNKINSVTADIMLYVVWGCSALGVFFTFMDQEKFKKIQMFMYIGLGWAIVFVLKPMYQFSYFGKMAVIFCLAGGISFTLGAVIYGIGKKIKYFHAVFHIFVLIGSILMFIGIYKYLINM